MWIRHLWSQLFYIQQSSSRFYVYYLYYVPVIYDLYPPANMLMTLYRSDNSHALEEDARVGVDGKQTMEHGPATQDV